MPWTDIKEISQWFQRVEYFLPLAVTVISLVILLGCAIASWLCPSEKKDGLFHRHVM